MQFAKPVGRDASSRKYDLLTALGAYALSQGKSDQRRVLRLITLITARYNWTRDVLAVGQREIASLWCCDERTVKREVARLKALGWLLVRRQGVRGRVTEYRLDLDAVLEATRPRWAAVGSDFVERLDRPEPSAKIVRFPHGEAVTPPEPESSLWGRARLLLFQNDPAIYATWFRPLTDAGFDGTTLRLQAPSRFHAEYVRTHFTDRLHLLCRRLDSQIADVELLG